MAIVVSCPECQRKLKIAPTSIGKSVKCPCGNVFKAHEASESPPAPKTPSPAAPTTLVVACDNCQAKLKVPASARGRKMKCSKCSATFVVPTDETPAAPPEWSSPAPPARSTPPTPPAFQDEEPAEEPRPARKSAPSRPPFFDDAEADEPAPTKKSASSRAPFIQDDVGAIANVDPPRSRAKGKPAARAAAATAPVATQTPAPASGCGGCVLNIFVLLIVVAYIGAFVPLYFFRPQIAEYVELPFHKPPATHGKALKITPRPDAEDGKKNSEIELEKKDNVTDKDKQDNVPDKDKEKKNDVPDKDAKDTENKNPASDPDGATLFQLPIPTSALQPRLDSGRPAKPGKRTARRATAAD
jgi:predicted Zn finger-like uncharacterized protein